MGIWERYRLRLKRRQLRFRAFRKRRELAALKDRTSSIGPRDVIAVAVLRNECVRLPYFLRYYRDLGVRHFFMIDNGSTDGSRDYLAEQEDVSLWSTKASYKAARFGADWLNWLLFRYARGHWILALDVDEFFVYPFCDTRPVQALTDWLDTYNVRSFPAMVLDMYPKDRSVRNDTAKARTHSRSLPISMRATTRFPRIRASRTSGFKAAREYGPCSPMRLRTLPR